MKIKNLLLFVATMLLVANCCLFRKVPKENNNDEGDAIMYGITMMLNERQLDSMITVDNLPLLEDWINAGFYDYETNARVYKYTYIKELNENNELIYVTTVKDTLYKVVKRMTEINKAE